MSIPFKQVLEYNYLLRYYRAKALLLQIKTLLAMSIELKRSNALQGNIHVVLRFDDATMNQYEYAYPLLESLNLKAVLAVPTGYVGKDSVTEGDRILRPIDSWQKLREMLTAGWDLVPHGRFHLSRGPYLFLSNKILMDEIIRPVIDFKINMGYKPRVFVPPGLITHQNPLGKRELKLLTNFYHTILLSSGYNYPIPILNRIYRGAIWSIPATDSDEWIQMLMKFLKSSKVSRNYGIIIIFFHEIYVAKNDKTQYGFSYGRLKILLNNLIKLGINVCSLSDVIAEIRKHQGI
jgi:peptidoglycan/xylan/chitin deacetylase (PgdA/CDA1 family)